MSSNTIYPSGYYVYAYIRSKDSATAKAGTPYYIGKGKGRRAYLPHIHGNTFDLCPSSKDRIIILEQHLTEIGAFALERRLIRWFGKKWDNSGILCNITDGGYGGATGKGRKMSEETKDKLRKSKLGKKLSPNHRRKIGQGVKGRIVSEETRQKLSIAKKGMKQPEHVAELLRQANYNRRGVKRSPEACKAISAGKVGKKQSRIVCPHCGIEGGQSNMTRYHFDNCKLKFNMLLVNASTHI